MHHTQMKAIKGRKKTFWGKKSKLKLKIVCSFFHQNKKKERKKNN